MKKIIFYIRVTDTLLTISICFLLFSGFLVSLYIYNTSEKIMGIAGGICFLLFIITSTFSLKYLFRKEKAILERYANCDINDVTDAFRKFDDELKNL